MIHSKPSAIIYIRRDSLIIAGKKLKPARLNFPTSVIHNLELIDETQFIRGCREFFANHDIKGKRVQVVLDDSIVFSKLIGGNIAKPAVARQAFIDAMPFARGQRVCIIDHVIDTMLYATNQRLYQSVLKALDQAGGGKVIAVTPAAAYGVSVKEKLVDALTTFATNGEVARRCNLLDIAAL